MSQKHPAPLDKNKFGIPKNKSMARDFHPARFMTNYRKDAPASMNTKVPYKRRCRNLECTRTTVNAKGICGHCLRNSERNP